MDCGRFGERGFARQSRLLTIFILSLLLTISWQNHDRLLTRRQQSAAMLPRSRTDSYLNSRPPGQNLKGQTLEMNRKLLSYFSVTSVLGTILSQSLLFSQSPPEGLKNLQFFPKDITRPELVSHMRNFSFALGVPCTHCHGTAEQTGFSLQGVDFSLDIKPTKTKAREMLRMTAEINSKLLPQISQMSELNLKVSCFTCHSGIPLPEAIEARVLRKVKEEGFQAAVGDYRSIRRRYHGSAAYNFKEQPLVEAAADLHQEGQYQEAAAISRLNLEFHPESGQSKFALGEAYFEMGNAGKPEKSTRKS